MRTPFSLACFNMVLTGSQRIGDRFFAPNMFAGSNCFAIEMLVFLHVGRVDQQVEVDAGQHLIDMGVVIGDVVFFRPAFGPLWDDVASAHQLGVTGISKMWQVNSRDAAAANDPNTNSLFRWFFGCGGRCTEWRGYSSSGQGGACGRGAFQKRTAIDLSGSHGILAVGWEVEFQFTRSKC